jgi:hypothetical protein
MKARIKILVVILAVVLSLTVSVTAACAGDGAPEEPAAVPTLVDVLSLRVVPILEKGAAFVDAFVGALLAGRRPVEALSGALRDVGLDRVANWLDKVAAAVSDLWDQVKPFVVQILEWIGAHVELRDVLAALGVAISTVIIPAIGGLIASAAPVIAVFMGLVGLFTLVRTAWKEDWGGIRSFVQRATARVARIVSGLVDKVRKGGLGEIFASFDIGGILKRAWAAIAGLDWSGIGATILQGIGRGLAAGYEIVRGWVLEHIVTPLSTFITETDWSAVGQAILGKIGEIWGQIKTWVSDELGGLLDILTGSGEAETAGGGGILGILDKITGFVNGPGGTAISVIGVILGLLTGWGAPIAIVIGLVKMLSWAWENDLGGIREFTANLVADIEGWFAGIGTWAQTTFEDVKGYISDALSTLQPFFDQLQAGWNWINGVAIPTLQRWGRAFMRGLQPHLEKMQGTLTKFKEDLGPKLQKIWAKLLEAWDKISDTIMTKLWPAIQNLLEALGITDENVEGLFGSLGELAGFLLEVGLGVLLGTITFALDALVLAIEAGSMIIEGLVLNFTLWADALASVINEIDRLSKMSVTEIFEEFTGIELPTWLEPGSPPPLYYALRDIGKAMDLVAGKELPGFDMGLPDGTMSNLGRSVDRSMSAQDNMPSVVLYGPVYVEGVQDGQGLIEELQALAG